MLVDCFDKAIQKNPDLGRRGRSYDPKKQRLIPRFMENKSIVQENLNSIEKNIIILKDLQKRYKDETDGNLEEELLTKINNLNETNSANLKEATRILSKMKTESKKYKFDPELKVYNFLSNF